MGLDPASAAIIGGGVSLASSLFGGGNQGTGSQSGGTTAPWGPQQPFLTDGYGAALKAYNARVGLGPYTADQVAGGNSVQTGAVGQANQFASTEGASQPYNTEAEASTLMGAAPGYASTAQGLANGQDVAINPNFGSALTAAGTNGANAINNFTSGLQGVATTAAQDPTQRIEGDAAAYASSPTVQNSVNATNAQIQQTLNEQTVPGLNREAAMGGTLNSSRAGMAEGLANEGAGIAEGTADAGIYSNAYTQGLNTANSAYATGLGGQISANEGGLTGENAVANTAGNQNLDYQQANVQDQLAGNAQQGNAVSEGLAGGSDAVNEASADYQLGSSAGGLYQTLAQVP